MIGLAVISFGSAYFEFSNRVASGALKEAERWTIVPGWSIYLAVLSLLFVLPLIALVGVPLSALLLRLRRLTYPVIAGGTTAFWLALSCLLWMFPSNE
ncbi:MAG: hypothetical protein JOY88_07750 [Pelomonas sp.]|nr:hypothetical protein [Roseateles sp.]